MTRATVHIDETNPLEPKAVLTINGIDMPLSEKEFMSLYNEFWWAADHIKQAKKGYYSNLAHKSKETSHA